MEEINYKRKSAQRERTIALREYSPATKWNTDKIAGNIAASHVSGQVLSSLSTVVSIPASRLSKTTNVDLRVGVRTLLLLLAGGGRSSCARPMFRD